ncbi:MAG: sugar kinase [Desulfobacca sp. 4484_104]|nr:MAG: sugar kinase [Desulfobacca sp. 4484_104]RLA88802.1 MAG: sugar kinase [Deltaproteobacteria bacterium]
MLVVVGTIPVPDFPLVTGQVTLNQDLINIGGYQFPVNRGTPALLGAALISCEVLGQSAPYAYLVGDLGLGEGSRRLYKYLEAKLKKAHIQTLVFHYLQPDVDWHNRVLFAVAEMSPRPILIADAGFMYAAKMSGQASHYDLFIPDVGELAFLADGQAPHPFYTRGFILHQEDRVPELIARAYAHDNAARYLLVKGHQDYLATAEGILATVDHPVEPALEAIGGTGDTLTGIAAALVSTGTAIDQAAIMAAQVNRFAGHHAHPTPATQVAEIIRHIPAALAQARGTKL